MRPATPQGPRTILSVAAELGLLLAAGLLAIALVGRDGPSPSEPTTPELAQGASSGR